MGFAEPYTILNELELIRINENLPLIVFLARVHKKSVVEDIK